MKEFDLVVIGSGPAGEKAAVKAAYFGYQVALIEKEEALGGAGVQTGTLPSKTLKETALYLSGIYHRGIFGVDKELDHAAGVNDFMYRKDFVVKEVEQSVKYNLQKHGVHIFQGLAEFVDEHKIKITGKTSEEVIIGNRILIATGSYPYHPSNIPFEGVRIHDSDTILEIDHFPKSLCVLGAGVIGCEYATIFAAMGIKTFIVNDKDKILGFLDKEVSEALVIQMKASGVVVLFSNSIREIQIPETHEEDIRIVLANGESLYADMFLFAAGRSGQVKDLQCHKAGILLGDRQTVIVNDHFQTNIEHIYAVGDVVGFPALASTGMDQGRMAITHMFGTGDLNMLTNIFPYGIYTVPEVSMVGMTEEEARLKGIDYNVGYSYYRDVMRGKIMGDKDNGFMKLVFEKKSRVILGVHIMGSIATELIHYGMLLVKDKKTLDEVIATVFNYPTLHDLYKYASYDGLGNLAGKKIKKAGEIFTFN